MSSIVLITGASGFLGSYVARRFARAGWTVAGIGKTLPPEDATAHYFPLRLPDPNVAHLLRTHPPSVCVHCAGRASVPFSMRYPWADFHDNTAVTAELLHQLHEFAPQCRLLLLSSAAVYGNPESLPVRESHQAAPLSPYGLHKLQAEMLCEQYSSLFGLSTAAVRIFSAYGPGLRKQVMWDICARLLSTGRLALHGTGRESRDFIHAEDVAEALLLLAEKAPAHGEIYNLATGRETTIAELARAMAAALGRNIAPEFDGAATPGNPLNWRADISALESLGFRPRVSLEDGVRGFASWAQSALASQPSLP